MPVNPSSNETSMNRPQSAKRITIVTDDSGGTEDGFDSIGHLSQYSRQRPKPVRYQRRLHPMAILIWSSGMIFCGVSTIIVQAVMMILDIEATYNTISTGIWSGVVCIVASILGFSSIKKVSNAILGVMVVFSIFSFLVNAAAVAMGVITIKKVCIGPPDFANEQCRVQLILNVVDVILFAIGGLCAFVMSILSSQGLCCSNIVRDYKVESNRNDSQGSMSGFPLSSSATIVPLSIIEEDENQNSQNGDRPSQSNVGPPRPGQFVAYLSGNANSGFVRDEPISRYSSVHESGPKHGTPFDPKAFRDIHLRQQSVQENRRVRQTSEFSMRPSLKRIISQQ